MVIAAECSLDSKFSLISSHVLRRAVAHECPFRNPDKFPLKKLREKLYSWSKITLSAIFETAGCTDILGGNLILESRYLFCISERQWIRVFFNLMARNC